MAVNIYLKFEYLNPRANRYDPYPAGIEVKAWDYDFFGSDDYLAKGNTDSNGCVQLIISDQKLIKADPSGKPDIFFEVYPRVRIINGIPLPKSWSSYWNRDTTGRRGYYLNFSGSSIGTLNNPVTFHIDGFNAYLEFYYYNERVKKTIPIPANVSIEMRDFDIFSKDELLGIGITDNEGKAIITSHLSSIKQEVYEGNPEIYFKVNTQGISDGDVIIPACKSTRSLRDNFGRTGIYLNANPIGQYTSHCRFVLGIKHFIRVKFILITSDSTDTSTSTFQSKLDKVRMMQDKFKNEYVYATYGRSLVVGMQDVAVIKMGGEIPSIGDNEGDLYEFIKNVAQKFYLTQPDLYDYFTIYEDFGEARIGSRHYTIKNNIEHVGMSIFDNSNEFGSNGVLKGIGLVCDVNEIPATYSFMDSKMHLVMHETIGHQYGIYGLQQLNISGPIHFNHDTAGPTFSYLYTHPWRMTADGKFFVVLPTENDLNNGFFVRFHPLLMYNMGLFTPEEVGSIMVVDTSFDISHRYDGPSDPVEGTAIFHTMGDIMAEWGGPRRVIS